MTFCRLGLWDEKLYMVITGGESMRLSEKERKAINNQTSPTWPHVHTKLDCSFEEFLSVFPCNHVLGMIGDKVQALNYACEITGIVPVILGPEGKKRIAPVWERVKK